MLEEHVNLQLDQDSQAAMSSIIHVATFWRTRHYALRAPGIRDHIADAGIVVEHVMGRSVQLTGACAQLQMGPNDVQPHQPPLCR